MHPNSLKEMANFRSKYVLPGKSVLDIGAMNMHGNYRSIFRNCVYVGMDIQPGSNVNIVGYENITEVYDVVISGQTMEHVKKPWDWLKHLTKYSRDLICIIAPNTAVEHRYPLDTYRYFPDGMRDLFEYANIVEIEIYKSQNDTIGIGRV